MTQKNPYLKDYKYTHSVCVVFIASPLQEWLPERASILRQNIMPVLFPWFPSKMKVSEITLRRSPHFLASTSVTNNYVMTLKLLLLCSSILTTREVDGQGVRVMTCVHSRWLPTCRCGNARRQITNALRRLGEN